MKLQTLETARKRPPIARKMPLLEEISDGEDIDNMDMDLAEFDPTLRTAFAPKLEKTVVRSQDQQEERLFPNSAQDEDDLDDDVFEGKAIPEEVQETLKTLQILYPCYFDKNRSRKQGRRVSLELSVQNPVAQTIVDACASLHLVCMQEAVKTHPQDWGNPGRVRVLLKDGGKPVSVLADKKRHLLVQVAKYLKAHQTTPELVKKTLVDPSLKHIQPKEVPVPKGLKMNTLVPLHSPLMQGTDPMSKGLYEAQPEAVVPPPTAPKALKQKNKFMHVRR